MSGSRTLFLGVGAGAATFKAVALASHLAQRGFTVRVAMTAAAQSYVGPLSFRAVTGQAVITAVDAVDSDGVAAHLKSGQAAAFVVVPATADLIAKLAHGLADDPVSLAALSAPDPRFFCPAMNDRMWRNPVVQDNVRRLEALGWTRIGPVRGHLAEGYEGEGRMSEPEAILQAVLAAVDRP